MNKIAYTPSTFTRWCVRINIVLALGCLVVAAVKLFHGANLEAGLNVVCCVSFLTQADLAQVRGERTFWKRTTVDLMLSACGVPVGEEHRHRGVN